MILPLTLLAALPLPPRQAEPPTPFTDALAPLLRERIPRLLDERGEPGLALALVENGRVTVCEGFGLADRESGSPVGPDTLFNVGSISKSVAAWVVMRLVAEDPELGLDAPVLDRIEGWSAPPSPHDVGGVTIRRLLEHTAGLSMASIAGHELDAELPSLTDELEDVRLVLPPGTRHEYSGGGYLVLQLLVEERTGEPFQEAAARLVLEPLGMTSSRFGYDPSIDGRCATPYTTRFEERRDETGHARWRHRAFVGSAGAGLYTSARDLGRFLAAHCDAGPDAPAGRGVLAPDMLRAMASGSDVSPGYGLGYELPPPADGHPVLMHGGSNHGWKSTFMLLPDLGLGIAVLTNTDGAGARMAVLGAFRDEILAVLERR